MNFRDKLFVKLYNKMDKHMIKVRQKNQKKLNKRSR